MHRSSETIGAIASALAKAQGELTNPEKSLLATIRSPFPREGDRTFRYASLASGLDIVRKSLGQHEIATIQTTTLDQATGHIQLTTLLAHASGEWISSDLPVCPISETSNPHRMGAALSYARRYALFALVGIAGEDDLDAPDLLVDPSPAVEPPFGDQRAALNRRKPHNGSIHKPPLHQTALASDASAALRDQMLREIGSIKERDSLALWAHRQLAAKSTLTDPDAKLVERAYLTALSSMPLHQEDYVEISDGDLTGAAKRVSDPNAAVTSNELTSTARRTVKPICKPVRHRDKAHRIFVASQPCLVCQRLPCDAHHLKFAEPRAMGMKVSDEFTVPLCRQHHNDLHRHGNEMAWWADLNLGPLEAARHLWELSHASKASLSIARATSPGILGSHEGFSK